jgi:hypothetical protein
MLRGHRELRHRQHKEIGENSIIRSIISCTFHRILAVRSIKKYEIGRACSTHGQIQNCTGKLKESDSLEEPGVDEKITLKYIIKK